MSEETKSVPLYRLENPTIPRQPNDGSTSHEDLIGQWFSPDLDTALVYLRKTTQTFGRDAAPADGAQLVVAYVPAGQLEGMHVHQHPIASRMDVEDDNYLVPRDGSVPTEVIPLDDVVGELKGTLGNIHRYQEACQRVHALVGSLALEK